MVLLHLLHLVVHRCWRCSSTLGRAGVGRNRVPPVVLRRRLWLLLHGPALKARKSLRHVIPAALRGRHPLKGGSARRLLHLHSRALAVRRIQ